MAKKKIPPALAKFQRQVARIRKETGKSFRSAQEQASRENRAKGKKVSGTKRKGARKASGKSKSPSTRRMGSLERPENLRSVVSDARKAIHAELGWALASQRTARTKKEKKGLQPRINELTRQLKALSA
jgi:hypothetical protein